MSITRIFLVMLFVCSFSVFAEDSVKTDSAYQGYKKEAHKLDLAVKQSYKDYFKHDSLVKVWNKKSDTIPEVLVAIIERDAIEDSVSMEETRTTLVLRYKIREAVAALAQQDARKLLALAY